MKKMFAVALGALFCLSALAQPNFGAGYSMLTHRSDYSVRMNGAYAGVGYDFKFRNRPLALQAGMYYQYEMTGDDASLNGFSFTSPKWREQYISIPIRLAYSMEVAPFAKVFGYAGPLFSIGMTSKAKVSSGTVDLYSYGNDWKRYDMKLGIGIGADFIKHIRVTLGFDWGLLDRCDDDAYNFHTHYFHTGIAYLF